MDRRNFVKTLGVLGGGSLLAGFPLNVLAQNSISMKYDSYVTETAGPSIIDTWFLNELEKRTNGEVKVRRFWAQSLNKVGEHLTAIASGTTEIALISPGYYQADLPVTRGLEWYYRMNKTDALQLVCRDIYEEFQPLKDEWEKRHKAKVLYWTTWNYAPLVTKAPITSLEDFKGKRIRGYGVATDVIQRLGGTAVPMAAPEVYTSIERGVLDGVYGFDFITAVSYKLHEIAPYFTDIGDGPHAPAAVVMNIDVWNKLPDKVKVTIEEIVSELYGGKFVELVNDYQVKYVETALEGGVKFFSFSDELKAEARKLIQPAQVERWAETVAQPAGIDGKKMQELVEAAIKKHDPNGKILRPETVALNLAK